MTKQEIANKIAQLQAELANAPDDSTTQSTQSQTVNDNGKEKSVDDLVNVAANTAGNWIHSPSATKALSTATGIAPLFIHLGFLLASLFQHHSEKAGIPVPQLAPPAQK